MYRMARNFQAAESVYSQFSEWVSEDTLFTELLSFR